MLVMLINGAEPAGPAVVTRGGTFSACGAQLWEPFIKLVDVAGFFVCWPPPFLNVLTLSALRSGDARALDLCLAASHHA